MNYEEAKEEEIALKRFCGFPSGSASQCDGCHQFKECEEIREIIKQHDEIGEK